MIFKSLKEKSIQKLINSGVNRRAEKSSEETGIADSLVVVINYDKLVDYRPIMNLAKELGIENEEVHILGYVEKLHKNVNYMIPVFSKSSISVKGRVKDSELSHFIKRPYGLLINYYTEEIPEVLLISSMINASFKVGLSEELQNLNDLILKVDENNFIAFQQELIKYLKILKRL